MGGVIQRAIQDEIKSKSTLELKARLSQWGSFPNSTIRQNDVLTGERRTPFGRVFPISLWMGKAHSLKGKSKKLNVERR
jgi:hypothetical protein